MISIKIYKLLIYLEDPVYSILIRKNLKYPQAQSAWSSSIYSL